VCFILGNSGKNDKRFSASGQKISSPETPPFFAREPWGFPARPRQLAGRAIVFLTNF